QIDERVPAVLENAEFVSQAEIHRAASELLRRQLRRDLNLALGDVPPDVHVGQNHSLYRIRRLGVRPRVRRRWRDTPPRDPGHRESAAPPRCNRTPAPTPRREW